MAVMQESRSEEPCNRKHRPDDLKGYTKEIFLDCRVGSRKAAPFRYIKADEYLEKHPRFAETNGSLY